MKKLKILFITALIMCGVLACMQVSAASSTTVICEHSWSLADSEGAPCKGYTNVYACYKCLATKTETLPATQGHSWYNTFSQEAACETIGYVQGYCQVCYETRSETVSALGHKYTYASNNDATCTKDGTRIRKCQRCSETDIVADPGSAKGHSFAGEWIVVVPSDCLEKGVSKQLCTVCGAGNFRYDELGAHQDKNGDYKCDVCSADLSPASPGGNDSSTDNDEVIKDCSCNCHKGGIKGFFWKIGNFFCKLFRIKDKQICSCGVYHFSG